MNIYCGQLGMVIELDYCISMHEGLPCRNTIFCWEGRLDITRLLREKFDADELKKAFGEPPRTRIDRIAECIVSQKQEE